MSQKNPSSTDLQTPRKRYRPAWKDQPSFLDASASIAAATFGARRLVELEQLYVTTISTTTSTSTGTTGSTSSATTTRKKIVAQDVAFQSGGGQTSSRHLRRRTTSHQSRRHRHRFPNNNNTNNNNNTTRTLTSTITRKAKRSSPSTTLAQGHYDWKIGLPQGKIVQWVATHIWHAKRFHMETLWGWKIPVAHTNRGARAALRLSQTHCLIQDVTWERQPIHVEFRTGCPKPNLVQCLARILPSWGMNPTILKDLERHQQQQHQQKTPSMVGEDMMHHIDQFPRGSIGPIWWRVMDNIIQIMVHPTIRQAVLENVSKLFTDHPSILCQPTNEQMVNGIQNGSCVFRLFGTAVMEALQKTFKCRLPGNANDPNVSWQELVDRTVASDDLNHGTIVHATIELLDHGSTVQWCPVVLVRVQPRPLDCSPNRAIAGWDLYCDSQRASQIWNLLSMNCAAVGMVEHSHLLLECDPPLPVFPRDFVDCEEAAKYWMSSSRPTRDNPQSSWSRVRQLYEGGWGRLPLRISMELKTVKWSMLISPLTTYGDADADDADVDVDVEEFENGDLVMVRGTFGEPFVTILEGCGRRLEPPNESNTRRLRRNRRRAGPANATKQVQPAGKEHVEAWRKVVRSLLTSLSLPAIVQAHIVPLGKGTMQSGDKISIGDSDVGFVTTGAFSPSRGHCHGFGIIGAARLLKELAEAEVPSGVGRITPSLNGRLQVRLTGSVVCSHGGGGGQEVALSLVL